MGVSLPRKIEGNEEQVFNVNLKFYVLKIRPEPRQNFSMFFHADCYMGNCNIFPGLST